MVAALIWRCAADRFCITADRRPALPAVLARLHAALKPGGALLASNPRGQDEEGFIDGRYACFYSFKTWRRLVGDSGFVLVDHYFRPPGKPRRQQPWLATLWRKSALPDQRNAL